MTNVQEVVRRSIEGDGALRRDLGRGLINIRALARYIQATEITDDSSIEAIISAIRRYPIKESSDPYSRTGGLMKKLTMRNKIVDVAILNDPEIPAALGKFASKVDYGKGETFRVVAGVESIRAVIDEKKLEEMKRLINPKSIRKIVTGLTEIIVSLGDEAEKTPGVVSVITSELAMHDINMMEFMSCVPEIIIVVDESDSLKAYESLEKLAKS